MLHRFGKRQMFNLHHKMDDAAARLAAEAVEQLLFRIHGERCGFLSMEGAEPPVFAPILFELDVLPNDLNDVRTRAELIQPRRRKTHGTAHLPQKAFCQGTQKHTRNQQETGNALCYLDGLQGCLCSSISLIRQEIEISCLFQPCVLESSEKSGKMRRTLVILPKTRSARTAADRCGWRSGRSCMIQSRTQRVPCLPCSR